MSQRINYAELDQQLDYNQIADAISQMTRKDNRQGITLADMLAKMRDEILTAYNKRHVNCRAIAAVLTKNGLSISAPTLRKYIRSETGPKKHLRSAHRSGRR